MRANKKKIAAVGVTCLVTSGLLLGSVEYASHTFAATKADATVKAATEKVEQRSAEKKTASKVIKEESVYVTLDASGQKQDVIVSDWLKNSGLNTTLKDVSNLTDIQNTKGDEKFSQDGEDVSWETGENDIYYQGKTQEELPVGMEITYKLDGEEIEPEELIGKSGKLEMDIQYTNTAKKTVTLGGEEKEIYTPFVMATGMILATEKFSNVSIDNGQVVSEGDNDIVMIYGMPGLKENLDLDSLDLGDDVSVDTKKISDKITDKATITADVTDFELGATYTVATPNLFKDIDFDDISDGDDLDDKLDELKDAANELVDGSEKINDGLDTLESSFAAYEKAIKKLQKSVKTLNSGAKKIKSATKTYTKSTDKLLGAVNQYVDGAGEYAKQTKTYAQKTKLLLDGVGSLYTSASKFPASYEKFNNKLEEYTTGVNTLLSEENMNNLTDATSKLKGGMKSVDKGAKGVKDGLETINSTAKQLKETESTKACIDGLKAMQKQYSDLAKAESDTTKKAQYEQMEAAAKGAVQYMESAQKAAAAIDAYTNGISDGDTDQNGQSDLTAVMDQIVEATDIESKTENLYTGLAALDASANSLEKNASTIRSYKTPVMEGSQTVKGSIQAISANLQKIYNNGGLLTKNNKKLTTSADSLVKNASTVKKNSKKLTSNSKSFRKATKTLATGTEKLLKGVNTLAGKTGDISDGIVKLADGATDLYNGMKEFREEGVNKLANTVTDLLDGGKDLKDRAEAISDASKDYKSFSGISKGMDGSVKFIMTTSELKAEDN